MEKIIDPVDVALIKSELTPDKRLGDTNKGGNVLYVVSWKDSPNTVREIGRLREVSYREAGASSGKSIDLDEYDTMEVPYSQLIVWDPDAEAIIGGYRFILGQNVSLKEDGQPNLTSSHLYKFSDEFISDYLPHVMELGRSWLLNTRVPKPARNLFSRWTISGTGSLRSSSTILGPCISLGR